MLWQFGKRLLFLRFHNSSRNTFANTSEGNCFFFYFSNNTAKTSPYGLKILRNIEIKYFFYYSGYFHVVDKIITS